MQETRYEAHPSMLRMRPFSTPLVTLLMLAGILIAAAGAGWLPVALPQRLDGMVLRLIGIAVFALSALQLFAWWLSSRSDHLIIRGDELIWTHGLLSKSYIEVKLSSVRTVRLHQSLLQRILNAGDIRVYTSGDVPELVVRGLPNPNRLRELIKAVA
ncbi:MAG: PH domain-containing protein [Thiocapsa sp.]|nr:PH domain-containing protein [Thiocapsa sp.]MCG6895792.1 PH domain-containing protein [Thiocapsa sp.]